MHFPGAVLATLIAAAAASQPGTPPGSKDFELWCQHNEVNCLQTHLDQKCYDCLHPIEMGCRDDDHLSDYFHSCMCHIPSDTWSHVKQCIDDPATNCAKDRFGILHVWEVACSEEREENRGYVCDKKNQEGDLDLQQLSEVVFFDCDATPAKPPVSSTKTVSTSAPTATGTTTKSTTAAPSSTHSATESSVPCPSSSTKPVEPTKSGNSTVFPTMPVTGAAAAGGQVALLLAGVAAAAAF